MKRRKKELKCNFTLPTQRLNVVIFHLHVNFTALKRMTIVNFHAKKQFHPRALAVSSRKTLERKQCFSTYRRNYGKIPQVNRSDADAKLVGFHRSTSVFVTHRTYRALYPSPTSPNSSLPLLLLRPPSRLNVDFKAPTPVSYASPTPTPIIAS